jgi:hypothetical protein
LSSRLGTHLRRKACTKQKDRAGKVNPEQQCHDCPENTVEGIEFRKRIQVPTEKALSEFQKNCNKKR